MQNNSLEKIVISTGVGKLRDNAKFADQIMPEITQEFGLIAGQKAALRTAKISIAGFKVREGDTIGLTVTLRGKKMKDFLARLINITLPRVRDFRGIDLKNFDAKGNLTIGIKDHNVFSEIDSEKCRTNFGLQITFVADLKNKQEGIGFFRELGLPLMKQ